MELDKLRQVAEERAVNSSKGLASVLGIANSSPLSHLRSDSTVPAPMSAVSFKPGMSVYRPAAASTTASINSEERCPPTPSLNEGKRSKLSTGADENLNSASNLNFRFTEALNANTIPFSPVRASAQGINLVERESCPKKLSSRQKQIDYGKNTAGYSLYTAQVPKNQRKRGDHPWTPNKFQICSKRSWDGQVRKWRRALHKFDPESKEVEENGQFDEFDESCEIKSNE
jgi:hypothetical protein